MMIIAVCVTLCEPMRLTTVSFPGSLSTRGRSLKTGFLDVALIPMDVCLHTKLCK